MQPGNVTRSCTVKYGYQKLCSQVTLLEVVQTGNAIKCLVKTISIRAEADTNYSK